MNDLSNPQADWKPDEKKPDRSWLIFLFLFAMAFSISYFIGKLVL